jgi:hypothetical protein
MMHEVLQPAKDEGKGPTGPIAPRFIRPTQSGQPTPAPTPGEDAVVVDGQAYIDGDA